MSETQELVIRSSILEARHSKLGAELGPVFGWSMPLSYGNQPGEHQSVRTGVGLIDLSFSGAIRIGGAEGMQFLNGLITNDVKTLAKGRGMAAGFLNGHGKVRALCRVLGLGDGFLILTDPQTHEKVFKFVFPFTYAGDFLAEDVSDSYRILSVQGPKATLVMKEICFEPVPPLEEHAWFETIIAGQHVMVARASHTGESGYDILIRAEGLVDVWDFILMKGEFHSIAPVGQGALDLLRIEAGIPVYGIDADENNMMLETGLTSAVSYTKGCYTGQEAVAMATYRGHVSKKLSGLVVQGDRVPSPGEKIMKGDKNIGHVTSAVLSPTLDSVIALGYVRYAFMEPGSDVELLGEGDSRTKAKIVELPFYNRSDS